VSPTARRNARLHLVGLGAFLTGSSAAAAAVGVCLYAPSLLGPLAGVLADRVRRKPYLVAVNLASAGALLPLLVVDRYHAVWVVYAVMVVCGLSLVLVDTAESALFAAMLPAELRQQVNGIRLTLQEGGRLCGQGRGLPDRPLTEEEAHRDAEHAQRQVDEVVEHGVVLVRQEPE